MSGSLDDAARRKAVRELITLSSPLTECILNLSRFEWDYSGDGVSINRSDVEKVLNLYLSSAITATEVAAWAEAIELRDDITFDGPDEDWVRGAIFDLSNPDINGVLNFERARKFIA